MAAIILACVLRTSTLPQPPMILQPPPPPVAKNRTAAPYLPMPAAPPPMDRGCDDVHVGQGS